MKYDSQEAQRFLIEMLRSHESVPQALPLSKPANPRLELRKRCVTKTAKSLSLMSVDLNGANLINTNLLRADFGVEVLSLGDVRPTNLVVSRTLLATCQSSSLIELWDKTKLVRIGSMYTDDKPLTWFGFSADGTKLLALHSDNCLRLWNPEQLSLGAEWTFQSILSAAISPSGETVAFGTHNREVYIFASNSSPKGRCVGTHQSTVTCMCFCSHRLLATGGGDGEIRIWDYKSWRCLKILRGHQGRVMCLEAVCAGTQLVSASKDQSMRLWNIAMGCWLSEISLVSVSCWSLSCSESVAILPIGTNIILKWDLRTLDSTQIEFPVAVRKAIYQSNELLVLGTKLYKAKLGDIAAYSHAGGVTALACSLDCQYIASAGSDSLIRLWRVRDGKCLQQLVAHACWVSSLSFSWSRLASCSVDGTLRVWNIEDGSLLATYADSDRMFSTIIISPTGDIAIARSCDGRVFGWTVGENRLIPLFASEVSHLTYTPTILGFYNRQQKIHLLRFNGRALEDDKPSMQLCSKSVAFTFSRNLIGTIPSDRQISIYSDIWVVGVFVADETIKQMHFTPNEKFIVVLIATGLILVVSVDGAYILCAYPGNFIMIVLSPDGRDLVASTFDKIYVLTLPTACSSLDD